MPSFPSRLIENLEKLTLNVVVFSVQDERVPGREQAAEAEHENGAESAEC